MSSILSSRFLCRLHTSSALNSESHLALYNLIIAKNLYYPTHDEKQKLASDFGIEQSDLNALLVQWRKTRRNSPQRGTSSSVAPGKSVHILRQWIHENQDSVSTSELKAPSSDAFRQLLCLTGLSVSQLRKCLAYVFHTQQKVSLDARKAVTHALQKTHEQGLTSLSEEILTQLMRETGLSRLQIRGIIRSYKQSMHPVTRKKFHTLKKEWALYCESRSFEEQQRDFSSFVKQMKTLLHLSTKQIKRITQRIRRASEEYVLRKSVREFIQEKVVHGETHLSEPNLQLFCENTLIKEDFIWRIIRRESFFPLTSEKKNIIVRTARQHDNILSRPQMRILSRRLCLSTKQIRYVLSTLPDRQLCSPSNGAVIREWFAQHQRTPSRKEFSNLVAESHLSPRRVSDALYRLRNPPREITADSLNSIQAHVKNHGTCDLPRSIRSKHIDHLVAETKLTRKQVSHFMAKYEDPPGKITPEKQQFVVDHYSGTNESLIKCKVHTQLSRKQIVELVRRAKRRFTQQAKGE